MMQTALQKERRELKQQQREAEANAQPSGFNNEWHDPMADSMYLKYDDFNIIIEFVNL